jgi:hypothetical protein
MKEWSVHSNPAMKLRLEKFAESVVGLCRLNQVDP